MSRFLKIATIFLGLNMISLFCCRYEPQSYKFIWKDITLANLYCSNDNKFNYGETSDSIFINSFYGIRINFSYELVSQNLNFSILNNANAALKCKGDEYFPENDIQKVEIFTYYNFDSSHIANSNITDYFESFTVDDHGNINGFKQFNNDSLNQDSYSKNEIDRNIIKIFLRKKPETNTIQKFKIDVIMKDNSVISKTTTDVILK